MAGLVLAQEEERRSFLAEAQLAADPEGHLQVSPPPTRPACPRACPCREQPCRPRRRLEALASSRQEKSRLAMGQPSNLSRVP